jgi:hypothetical protein
MPPGFARAGAHPRWVRFAKVTCVPAWGSFGQNAGVPYCLHSRSTWRASRVGFVWPFSQDRGRPALPSVAPLTSSVGTGSRLSGRRMNPTALGRDDTPRSCRRVGALNSEEMTPACLKHTYQHKQTDQQRCHSGRGTPDLLVGPTESRNLVITGAGWGRMPPDLARASAGNESPNWVRLAKMAGIRSDGIAELPTRRVKLRLAQVRGPPKRWPRT